MVPHLVSAASRGFPRSDPSIFLAFVHKAAASSMTLSLLTCRADYRSPMTLFSRNRFACSSLLCHGATAGCSIVPLLLIVWNQVRGCATYSRRRLSLCGVSASAPRCAPVSVGDAHVPHSSVGWRVGLGRSLVFTCACSAHPRVLGCCLLYFFCCGTGRGNAGNDTDVPAMRRLWWLPSCFIVHNTTRSHGQIYRSGGPLYMNCRSFCR